MSNKEENIKEIKETKGKDNIGYSEDQFTKKAEKPLALAMGI